MKYRFSGPMPVPGPDGDLVHPGDEREHAQPPDCPPWEPLEEPQAEVPPALAEDAETPPDAPARSPKGK